MKIGAFSANRVYKRDALAGLRALPDKSVDLVLTDPPYNIASKSRSTIRHGQVRSTAEVWGRWDSLHPFDYDLLILAVLSECYRVLRPGGALYMFTAREQNGYFIRRAIERGFTYRNQLVIVKKTPLPSLAKSNWRSAYEVCMYLTKGKPGTFNFVSQQACINALPYANTRRLTKHPTEKPLAETELIIRVSSNAGDLVLDPFMGSGTTAVAAKRLGRRFLGFELEEEYLAMTRQRLKSLKGGQRAA